MMLNIDNEEIYNTASGATVGTVEDKMLVSELLKESENIFENEYFQSVNKVSN